jgi:hypothetical protein
MPVGDKIKYISDKKKHYLKSLYFKNRQLASAQFGGFPTSAIETAVVCS